MTISVLVHGDAGVDKTNKNPYLHGFYIPVGRE